MGLRIVETAIILLSFGFLLSLHIALSLSSPSELILHSVLLLSIRLTPPSLSPALSLLYCSLAEVSCFMGCLLKRSSIRSCPLFPLPGLPAAHGGIVGVQAFSFLCHSSVAWFKSSMHVCARLNTHTLADSPECLIAPFSCYFSFFHPKNSKKAYSHTAAHLPKRTFNTEYHTFFPSVSHTLWRQCIAVWTLHWFPPPLSCDWTVNVAGGERNGGR